MEDSPRRRACVRCRNHKTRCLIDESHSETCQRCARLGYPCVFAPIEKREPRRATHTRVEELEKNVSALHTLLREKDVGADSTITTSDRRIASDSTATTQAYCTNEQEGHTTSVGSGGRLHTIDNSSLWSHANTAHAVHDQQTEDIPRQPNTRAERPDAIDVGLLTMSEARTLIQQYRTHYYPHYPAVYIPPTYSADELRKTKPTLFLAVLAVAAGSQNPDLAVRLDKKALEEYAIRGMIHSEKSPDLVQSLLINAIWFQLPKTLNQLKFNEYIRMAATMAMDIGIGASRVRSSVASPVMADNQSSHPLGNHQLDPRIPIHQLDMNDMITSPESWRAFLGIYIGSANIAITLRRPATIPVSSQINECVEVLKQSSQATSHDKELAAWTRLLRISDDIGSSFSYNDLYSLASILDVKTQLLLTAFDEKLSQWRAQTFNTEISGALRITYFAIRLYLFEIVLHLDFPVEDFKAPFQMSNVVKHTDSVQLPMKSLIDGVVNLIQSSHALLDVFLHMSVESIRALPVFCLIRVSSAVFILAKLSMICASSHSRLRSLINQSDVRMEEYMDRVLKRLRDIMSVHTSQTPSKFVVLLSYIRQRCNQFKLSEQSRAQRASGNLGQLLPGIVAHSRVASPNSSNMDRTNSINDIAATPSGESHESPWSQPMDDVDWRGNVLSFPGDGLPLGHNDENGTLMSCPTQ